jgi:hypothetical protein
VLDIVGGQVDRERRDSDLTFQPSQRRPDHFEPPGNPGGDYFGPVAAEAPTQITGWSCRL